MVDWKEVLGNIRNRNFSPFLQLIYKAYFQMMPYSGDKVLEEDWDVLIVLDACRYDFFEELNEFEGNLEKRKSVGGMTAEWLEKNFPNYYDDIVYVSANPHVNETGLDATINPQEYFHDYFLPFSSHDGKELGVTTASKVNEAAKEAVAKHPNKRIIIHYMQPHAPYIGEERVGEGSLYELYSEGVSKERLRNAYRSNLEYVLDEIEHDLLDYLDGKIVFTSDHGEMLGEKGVFAHGRGLYLKELVEVPWLVIEKQSSRDIHQSQNGQKKEPDEEEIKSQLADLGYGE